MLKLILFVYLILFFGLTFVWRSYQIWRKTGINPYRLKNEAGMHGFLTGVYRLVAVGVAVVILIYVFADSLYAYLTPITWLVNPTVTAVGLALLLVSFVWILIAQSQMGRSWRIGIDDENKTELVTRGVFRISRNPIFLGIRLNLLGLFLILPNAVTLVIWLVGEVAIQLQVFLEEDYLSQVHGTTYQQYQVMTSRYLGFPKGHAKSQPE